MDEKEDTMRQAYRPLTDSEKETLTEIKRMGQEFHDAINALGSSREVSLAKTRVEEAVMWATKHVTR